jgi:hypothetical protein
VIVTSAAAAAALLRPPSVILSDLWQQAAEAPMFKIVAMVFIGILAGIGFFDLGQEACTLAALLLGIVR